MFDGLNVATIPAPPAIGVKRGLPWNMEIDANVEPSSPMSEALFKPRIVLPSLPMSDAPSFPTSVLPSLPINVEPSSPMRFPPPAATRFPPPAATMLGIAGTSCDNVAVPLNPGAFLIPIRLPPPAATMFNPPAATMFPPPAATSRLGPTMRPRLNPIGAKFAPFLSVTRSSPRTE